MPAIFKPSANLAAAVTLLVLVAVGVAAVTWWWLWPRTDYPFPGTAFSIHGVTRAGAQMFFVFYFVATALHGMHMLVGIGLLAWIIRRARRGEFSPAYSTPVAVVGLYWSFVDMVWIVLYPLIYLIGRGPG